MASTDTVCVYDPLVDRARLTAAVDRAGVAHYGARHPEALSDAKSEEHQDGAEADIAESGEAEDGGRTNGGCAHGCADDPIGQ